MKQQSVIQLNNELLLTCRLFLSENMCACTCSTGHHVNERVDRLHQLSLLPLQSGVVAAGDSELLL